MKIEYYSTKSFRKISKRIQVLSNNLDIKKFVKKIARTRPDYVVGFGNTNGISRIEKYAVNKFGRRKISSDGKEKYVLFLPENKLPISRKPTFSYCNRLAYRISEEIDKAKLKTKNIFIHIKN